MIDELTLPISAAKGESGGVFSYATWSKDVPTLLPETDQVALNLAPETRGADVIHVPWKALREGGSAPLTWRATGTSR